jgi:hypothetical protein
MTDTNLENYVWTKLEPLEVRVNLYRYELANVVGDLEDQLLVFFRNVYYTLKQEDVKDKGKYQWCYIQDLGIGS